jgi:CHAD domain-containing protein
LLENGQVAAARRRHEQMHQVFAQVAESQELRLLLVVLDAFPAFLRTAQRQGTLRGMARAIDKRLHKQWRQLRAALKDPDHDRHRLRLLIKRVRYAAEAYPEFSRLPEVAEKRLKAAQGALGDWHDHYQWLEQAKRESDLRDCVPGWQLGLHRAEQQADAVLVKLTALRTR